MSTSQGKKTTVPTSKKRKGPGATSSTTTMEIRHPFLQFPQGSQEELFQILRAMSLEVGDMVMSQYDNPETVQFHLGSLVRQLSVPDFGVVLLYTDKFIEEEDLSELHRHIYYLSSKCWQALVPTSATYDLSRSKATALAPSLRYLHALFAHTLTGRRESISVVNTHDVYFLWNVVYRHVFDLLNIRQSGIMSPQGISSMLHMRMIDRQRGTDPPQYHLARSTGQEDPKDITDDVPPF
ncbi:hypothetical protein J1N35_033255 [Gossypium stocksii]|uniref:Uncharacterized protein n=1 Tax=Gossypium stocksii TaxID=47602 RepID=A0A9D3UQA4_9ROSI|nr:hypothetical protein J1N35_033255 [Gossypium stocksii]